MPTQEQTAYLDRAGGNQEPCTSSTSNSHVPGSTSYLYSSAPRNEKPVVLVDGICHPSEPKVWKSTRWIHNTFFFSSRTDLDLAHDVVLVGPGQSVCERQTGLRRGEQAANSSRRESKLRGAFEGFRLNYYCRVSVMEAMEASAFLDICYLSRKGRLVCHKWY